MQAFTIPIEGKYIIYRPLLRLAFVGNRAMADLALDLAGRENPSDMPAHDEATQFLEAIGFFQPDPPPPGPPQRTYAPAHVVLLLTNRCNLRCTYCYANGGEGQPQDLPLEVARAAIDYVVHTTKERGQKGFQMTFHGGGEPVQAWKTLRASTAYARSKDLPCRVSMVSNGVWSARQREWILNNLDELSISLDGGKETQDRQRPFASGRGSFRSVLRTVQALDQAEFPYGIRLTATAPWRGRLAEDVRAICEETNCQAMQVEPAFNVERGGHRGPTLEEARAYAEAFVEAFEVANEAGRRLTYSGARPWLLTGTFCSAPYGGLIVNPAGDLVACYEAADEAHPLGELSKVGHIADSHVIVDQEAREKLVDYLDSGRDRCGDCFCQYHCAGDCYTRAHFSRVDSPDGPSLRCMMNREITARLLLWYIMAGDGVWRGHQPHPQELHLLRTF